MRRFEKIFFLSLLLIFAAASCAASTRTVKPATASAIVITNDDQSGKLSTNTATLFTIQSDGTLGSPTQLTLGGQGAGGGYFASNRVIVDPTSTCAYFANGASNTIVGVNLSTLAVTGTFSASPSDNGTDNGIGMIMNSSYLYAAFSSSATIGTFAVQSGCTLQFISDIAPSGLNAGTVKGMAMSGSMVVFTYGDGSIESFNIAQGVPVSNGDAQNSTGSDTDLFPDGVVITSDGHFAIFGDDASGAAVEVSDISSGRLTPTVIYNLPSGFNSNNVLLSPDETLLYVINNTSGQVSAAFFDNITGSIGASCISNQLNGFDDSFSFLSNPVTQQQSGTGGVLYVPEFGSGIALINVSASAGQCTLTEAASSPVTDPNSSSLLSIAVAQTTQGGLYNPAPNSTLPGSDVTFQWYDAPAATASWIDMGSVPGGNQYYQSGSLPPGTLSATVGNLPTNGSAVYATLYFLIGGSWTPNPYTFTAFNAQGSTGALTTPTPGSALPSTTATFGWTAGSSATAYWLDLGNVPGGNQYYQSGNLGNALSTTASGLPSNGSTVSATLYSLVGGSWVSNAYTYTAFNVASAGGAITSPNPGSILPGNTVTFNWTAGAGATASLA